MDYTDLQPIIDATGVEVVVNTTALTTINKYGQETRTSTARTIKVSIQKYNADSHGTVNSIETSPNLVMYALESININDTVVYNSDTYKVIDLYIQPIRNSYLYYKCYLIKI